jgi:hypothetical protein
VSVSGSIRNEPSADMAASLISYTMVPACTILIVIMNQFVSPPIFRQPHPFAAFMHSHKAAEPGESPSARSSATQSSASEAVSSEPQKEKQARAFQSASLTHLNRYWRECADDAGEVCKAERTG